MAQLGQLVSPQPTAAMPGPVAQNAPPGSPPAQSQDLFKGWMEYLNHPEVQAGLLQFASSVLQPVGRGGSVLGNIGMALADAGGAAGRVRQQTLGEQQVAAENQRATQEQQRRQLETEGTLANQKKRAEIDEATQKDLAAYHAGYLSLEQLRVKNEAAARLVDQSLERERIGVARIAASASMQRSSPEDKMNETLTKSYWDNFFLNNPDATPQQVSAARDALMQMTGHTGAVTTQPVTLPALSTLTPDQVKEAWDKSTPEQRALMVKTYGQAELDKILKPAKPTAAGAPTATAAPEAAPSGPKPTQLQTPDNYVLPEDPAKLTDFDLLYIAQDPELVAKYKKLDPKLTQRIFMAKARAKGTATPEE